jgi:hypothetical protein
MPVAIPNAVPGAVVEECYDDNGNNLPVRRKGYISRVEYPNNAPYDSTCVKKVFAIFDRQKGEEETKLRRLNLVRVADQASLDRLKTDRRNEQGDAVRASLDIHQSPAKDKRVISQDKTEVNLKKGLSPAQAERLRSE